MTLFDFTSVFLLGLLGSGHCVGMCGGFSLAVAAPAQNWRGVFRRHLAYQAGKSLTYVFLAVIVASGTGFLSRAGWFSGLQVAVAVAVGMLMIGLGLAQVFELRSRGWWQRVVAPRTICRTIGQLTASPGMVSAFMIGWLNGFLPCGLVLAALFYLASFRSVADAAVGAVLFGLGTFPGLFAFGAFSKAMNLSRRGRLLRWAGVLIIGFGLVTLVRWVPAVHHWFHQILIPGAGRMVEWCVG